MTLDNQHKAAFADYEHALRNLEISFWHARQKIRFFATADPFGNKLVQILRSNKLEKTICIEGCSPAQAIKDIAAAVKL